ncbi:hypothetical protein TWF718_008744 [Orbilia javanica]|uniref:F-box domain-containing protein n=1 Tax=Orbilia javanica TaxID=47235 RepID=A0AAN8RLZ7_9PEZI
MKFAKKRETMSIFPTFPFEILELINAHLAPRDIAALTLTCKTFKERLGSGNQYFWYRILRKALKVNEHGYITPKKLDRRVNLQEFEEGVAYWGEVSDLFSGRKLYACRYCLEADPWEARDRTRALSFKSKGAVFGGDTVQQFCEKCFRDWFTNLETFASEFPQFPIPESLYHPAYGGSLLRIPSLIKHIESQGTLYADAITPSYKFKGKWTANGRDKKEAKYLDKVLCLLRECYTRDHRHLHIVLPPNGYYNLLVFSLFRDIFGQYPPYSLGIANFSNKTTPRLMEFIPLLKSKKKKEALNLATLTNKELLGDPENFDLADLDSSSTTVLRRFLEPLTNPGKPFHWVLLYSRLFFESSARDVRCYWCLRSNGGKDTVNNRFRYIPYVDRDMTDVPWITTHILTSHPDMMWKRPKNKFMFDNFTFYSSRFGNSDVVLYQNGKPFPGKEWENLKIRPDFENEPLEDVPVKFPNWCDGRITDSEYFFM